MLDSVYSSFITCSSVPCSRYEARWDPIKTSLNNKRHLPANGKEPQKKSVKKTPAKSSSAKQAGQFANACISKDVSREESSFATEMLGKGNGEIEPSEFEATAMKLAKLLPMNNDDSAQKTTEVKNLLMKLDEEYEISVTFSIRKMLHIPVLELSRQNHSALSQVANSLLEKLKASYDAAFLLRFKIALTKNNSMKVQQKVTALHKKIADGCVDEAFIREHNLVDLLAKISLYFKDRGLAEPKELIDIHHALPVQDAAMTRNRKLEEDEVSI